MCFLPNKMEKENNEDTRDYIDRLYSYYQIELKGQEFSYSGYFIYHKTEPVVDGKEGGFWHIITKEYLDQSKNVVPLPCLAANGMMVCNHICREFQDYDPYRTQEVYYANGNKATPRFICLNRCERINWIKSIIKEAERNPALFKIWDKRYKTHQVNTHIWYEKESFIIVLSKWKQEIKYNFVTSFVTNYQRKIEQCEKDYRRYIKNGKQPI